MESQSGSSFLRLGEVEKNGCKHDPDVKFTNSDRHSKIEA